MVKGIFGHRLFHVYIRNHECKKWFRYYYNLSNQLFSTVSIRAKTYWNQFICTQVYPQCAVKAAEFMIGHQPQSQLLMLGQMQLSS